MKKKKNPYAKALKHFTQKIVPDKTKYDRKKIKKEKKITNENDTNTTTRITKKIKEKAVGFENPLNGIFSGNTKQYPKYLKKKNKSNLKQK